MKGGYGKIGKICGGRIAGKIGNPFTILWCLAGLKDGVWDLEGFGDGTITIGFEPGFVGGDLGDLFERDEKRLDWEFLLGDFTFFLFLGDLLPNLSL